TIAGFSGAMVIVSRSVAARGDRGRRDLRQGVDQTFCRGFTGHGRDDLCRRGVEQFWFGRKDRSRGGGLSLHDDRELRRGRGGHCCLGKAGVASRFAPAVGREAARGGRARTFFAYPATRLVRCLSRGGGGLMRREPHLDVAGVRDGACFAKASGGGSR